jgi:hypothetical protein
VPSLAGEAPLSAGIEALARVAPAVALAEVNWPDAYPYRPRARFRIAHDGASLLVAFEVEERCSRASETRDNGRVWEDSCVEFFFQPGGEGGYYNFECNATGALLCAYGLDRHDRVAAPLEALASIRRQSRLEVERRAETSSRWSLLLTIPFTALFRHRFTPRAGAGDRANFYKCGDLLPVPHFLSWNPVSSGTPDFHRPDCFGLLTFQP